MLAIVLHGVNGKPIRAHHVTSTNGRAMSENTSVSDRPYTTVQVTRPDQEPIPAPTAAEAEMLAPLGEMVGLQVWA